jgi:hypothetical protein
MQFLVIRNIPLKRRENLLYLEPPKEEIYIQVPKKYKADKWPNTTNMPCYMCTITTKRKPFFVPSMIASDGTICRGNHPVVCGPSCGMSWILEKANDDCEIRRYVAYMLELLKQMTGCVVRVVEKSMDRGELQKFGGPLTEHQYQREFLTSPYMEKLYNSYDDYEADLS